MFLYGLSPLLTPLVATENPSTLDEAVDRAKVVETGYNYVPTKQIGLSTSVATKENPTMRDIVTNDSTVNDVDSLAEQLQKLTLNYANLAYAMIAQPQGRNQINREPTRKRIDETNGTKDRRAPITCYSCGKEGTSQENVRREEVTKMITGSIGIETKLDAFKELGLELLKTRDE